MKWFAPVLCCLIVVAVGVADVQAELQAGAARVDVTPLRFPVFVNGGMTSRSAEQVTSRLYARAIVIADGGERLAIVVVDSCMMPRPLLDEAKLRAAQRTKLRADRILISATHTHTAPASMGCLGTDADPTYIPYLREKLAEAIATAEANLEPARVGWAVENAADFTALRRWIRRPDRLANDPFGNPTVRANMHAGSNWEVVTGESGPEDPDLSLLSIQAKDGRPIAVLANFSMHYFSGVQPLSADYFGLFCDGLEQHLIEGAAKPDEGKSASPPPVVAMSHGCSGDIWRRDYTRSAKQRGKEPSIETYTAGLLAIAKRGYNRIRYRSDGGVAMAEARLQMKYRVPDKQRLQWAQQIVKEMGDRPPKTQEEVYAREQLILHERQSTEIVVQALRIGDIAIATTPNETYALTGLKLKLQSPLPRTMVIELANGGDGYIPPPEQHVLGGYNTWAARSAGLEVQAEPRIVATALGLLEQVADKPRRPWRAARGPGAKAIAAARPAAWWRLDDLAGPRARDASRHGRDAFYESGVVFFLAGADSKWHAGTGPPNRAAHFAGGRLAARLPAVRDRYTISLWFWNGMPTNARPITGWLLSRGPDYGLDRRGEQLGLGGKGVVGGGNEAATENRQGKLLFQVGRKVHVGRSTIARWTWNHVVLVRDGRDVQVLLNGNARPEIELSLDTDAAIGDRWFFGGRSDHRASWEGRLDEIAVFDRVLTPAERRGLRP